MDDKFEELKRLVTTKQLVEFYYQPLNRANKVCCPFHKEKTPSFSVNDKENMWKCFGCGLGGDGISFVAKLKNCTQLDAAKMIVQDFHLNLTFEAKELNPNQIKIRDYILKCQKDIDKTNYLQKRGLTAETLKQFGVGYDVSRKAIVIPYSSNFTYYQTRKVDIKEFFKPKTEDAGNEPLWNEIALKKQDSRPIFIVESPICAMSIMQYGGIAVSLCGKDNINKLVALCKQSKPKAPLILCLDNDDAGQKATEKLEEMLREIEVKFVTFNIADKYKDPNELLMNNPDKLCERIYQANLQSKRIIRGTDDVISASDLYDTEIEPIRWVVQDILPEGLAILVAASKIGKSWMMMQLANAIVENKEFLNKPTMHSSVLYFALEDNDRRLKGRMNIIWKNKKPSKEMLFKTDAKTLDTGLIDQLKRIVKINKGIKLIIFDTFQKIRGSAIKNESAYAYDYREMAMLKTFADNYNISILLVHHTRKMLDENDVFNMTSGSTGIMAVSDTSLIIFKKKRSDEFAILNQTGRDIASREIVISHSETERTWSIVGSPEEQEEKKKKDEFENSSIAITLLTLLKQGSSWTGTVRELVNRRSDMFPNKEFNDIESSIGKLLSNYDFEQRIYRLTHCEHTSKRKNNGVVHTFAPRQTTMWNSKSNEDND